MNHPATPMGNDLLRFVQKDFPITERPFHDLGERIGLSEKEVITSLRALIHDRTIREFGPVFDPRGLGYRSTLAAARIEKDRAAEIAAAMLLIHEITHNYYRDAEFNLWFTVTARNQNLIDGVIRRIEKLPGVMKIIDLPVERMFKISALFDAETAGVPPAEIVPIAPSVNDIRLIRALQNGIPLVERPFLAVAEELGFDESTVLERIVAWLDRGIVRRFGARINHRRAGFDVNALAAWDGIEVDEWGARFAELKQVSHCYLRRPHTEWSWRLYTMVHARTDEEMRDTLASMRLIARGGRVLVMRTLYELKKTSAKYFLED